MPNERKVVRFELRNVSDFERHAAEQRNASRVSKGAARHFSVNVFGVNHVVVIVCCIRIVGGFGVSARFRVGAKGNGAFGRIECGVMLAKSL